MERPSRLAFVVSCRLTRLFSEAKIEQEDLTG
jgi:hypothetical protein